MRNVTPSVSQMKRIERPGRLRCVRHDLAERVERLGDLEHDLALDEVGLGRQVRPVSVAQGLHHDPEPGGRR